MGKTLKEQVEDYLAESGMAPSAFGRRVLGEPSFVAGLRQGREPRSDTVKKVRDFIRRHPPTQELAKRYDRGAKRRASKVGARVAGKKRPSIFGGLKGTVTVPPGVDLTEPTGEVWAAETDKADG